MSVVGRSKARLAYLGDQLHVTILDTVVDHFDIVAGTLITDPVAAGLAIGLGSNVLEDILDVWPGLLVATRHERGTITSTLLTTRDTSANKANALLLEVSGTTVGVRVVRVTTIDYDVARVAVREELLDEVVDGRTSHDKQHHTTGLLQLGSKLLNGVSTNDGFACNVVSG